MTADSGHPALVIVHGPAGSGKSTLLAQWARLRPWHDEDLVWVTLQPDDAGVVPFWTRIGDSLVQAGLVAPDFALGTTAGDFSAMLLGSMATLGQPLTLVLDDYHLVAHPSIDQQLRLLLEQLDDFSLLLGSRSTSGLHSLELAARIGTVLVDSTALAFTLQESDELVATGGGSARAGLGKIIHDATGGWPLASQALIIEAQRDTASPLLNPTQTAGGPLFAREFARSALANLAADARVFVMKLSFADENTVELASELTGEPLERAEHLLAVLESDGVGTWQTRSGTNWFRMHPLLREAVEIEALTQLDPETRTWVRATLSDRLAQSRPLRALELAVIIRDWPRVERLILLNWVTFSYYNRAAYFRLLGEVPPAVAHANPGLLGAMLVEDYNIIGGDLRAMKRRHAELSSIAAVAPKPTVVGALNEVMIAGTHRLLGDLPRAIAYSDRTLAALGAADPVEVQALSRSLPILHTHVAVTHYVDRQTLRGIHEMNVSNDLATQAGSAGERLQAKGFMAFMHAARGDLDEARIWMQRCEATEPYDGWVGGYLQSPYLIARAYSSLSGWDAKSATDALDLLKFTEPVIEFWPWMAFARACADAISVGPAAAHATLASTLARAKQRPRPVPLARALLTAVEAQLLLLNGQTRRAHSVIDKSGLSGEPEIDLVSARLASLSRNDTIAIDLASAVAWSSPENPALHAEALLTLASCAFEAGQAGRAAEAFVDAATALERSGIRLPLLWIGRERITELVALTQEQGRTINPSIFDGIPDLGQRARRVKPLSGAETRVLSALRDTGNVGAAAELLFLSPETVRYHLKRSYRKLGVTSRSDALALAQELGMLEPTS